MARGPTSPLLVCAFLLGQMSPPPPPVYAFLLGAIITALRTVAFPGTVWCPAAGMAVALGLSAHPYMFS